MNPRIVAFDIGDRRIGVAVSDPFGEYAVPCETYFRTGNFLEDAEAIAALAVEKGADVVVCGLPLNADGTRSVQTQKTERFIAALKERLSVPIMEEDERYTTREARRDLAAAGVSAKKDKKKKNVDAIAAAYILEGYLAKCKEGETMNWKEEDSNYEDGDNIVELIDEDGNTLRYEHVGTIEYKGEWYCFFTPETTGEEKEDDEGEEIAVFHLVGEEDDEHLETIEDDELMDEVFAEFCNQYEESEDADEAASLDG